MQHSSLGGSKAEQFIACSAAPQLIEAVGPEEDADEPDYRRDGIAAHAVAAQCLRSGLDAWNYIGDPQYPHFDKEHVVAVQYYLDLVREASAGSDLLIEEYVTDPDRPKFRGGLDVAWSTEDQWITAIWDYKHGAGLAVDAMNNPQLLYLAYGLLLRKPEIRQFQLGIIQPRAFHREDTVRIWIVSAEDVTRWAETILHPAMERATQHGARFVPGTHCRFCPVKLACPALLGMSRAVALATTAGLTQPTAFTDEQLAAEAQLVKPAEMYFKAVMTELSRRMFNGAVIDGFKVVAKKADRVWEEGYEPPLAEPKPMSPAQVEAADLINGRSITAKHARSPQTGYTIAPVKDPRKAVLITSIPQILLDKAATQE